MPCSRALVIAFASVQLAAANIHAQAEPAARAEPAAQTASPALSWVRDEGADRCIPLPELAKRVEDRLGGAVFVSPSQATLHVEGRIVRRASGKGFAVSLTASDASGRVLGRRAHEGQDEDCRALDEALVLVIALTVDSSGGFVELPLGLTDAGDPAEALLAEIREGAISESTGTAPSADAPSAAVTEQQPREQKPDEESEGVRVGFGIGPLLVLGLVPDLGVGIELEPRVHLPADFVLGLRGSFVLPSSTRIEGGGELEISALLAGLSLCSPAAPEWMFGLRGCAGMELGSLRVDASGLVSARSPRRMLIAPWLSAEASVPIGTGVRVGLLLRATAPLIRDEIQVRDPDDRPREAYRVSVVTVTAGAALWVVFGG